MKRTFFIAALLGLAGMVLAQSMELTSARLYKKQGEFLKSLDFYNQVLEKDPNRLEAYYERGELYEVIAADSGKIGLAREIVGDNPDPQVVLYDRMIADFKEAVTPRTDKDEATIKKYRKKLDRILDERWDNFYFKAVHLDSAYTAAQETGMTEPDPKEYLRTAIGQLDLAIKMRPEKWNAYGLKAQMLGKTGEDEAALDNWLLARKYIESSDMKQKKSEDYTQAIDVIQGNLLQGYYNQKQYLKTVELADEILAKDAESIDALQFKAFSLVQLATSDSISAEEQARLKQEAIISLEKAKAIRADDPTIIYYIGQFSLQLGDTAAALAAFNEYLTQDEQDRDVLFALGVIYLEGGSYVDTERARDLFKKLTEFHPDDAAAWTNYGVALIRLGKHEEGKEAIEKGKSLSN